MPNSELREVYSAANSQEAHIIKAALEAAGIASHVVGDHLQNAVGELPAIAIAPRIWVGAEDFDRARNIILEHQVRRQNGGNSSKEWKCSKCGELNEPTFDICWNCQSDRVES